MPWGEGERKGKKRRQAPERLADFAVHLGTMISKNIERSFCQASLYSAQRKKSWLELFEGEEIKDGKGCAPGRGRKKHRSNYGLIKTHEKTPEFSGEKGLGKQNGEEGAEKRLRGGGETGARPGNGGEGV